ncbi:hypothetical protein VNO78_26159 [Psophocarpus tetragonolobus]|uniref:Uncharacterized protein n=1 Tax=Psophocarpus tetragonolobus TaxID=3891 RepID=A0AAN9RZF5_PSOTE
MGNPFTKNVKVELYKWSSKEFTQEYALVYTSLDDASKTSILRISVNKERVLCRIGDYLCDVNPLRFLLKVTAERDGNGSFKFGEVMVATRGALESALVRNNNACFTFLNDNREGILSVKSVVSGKSKRTTWGVYHSYRVGFRTHFACIVTIQCRKMTGLGVELSGPHIYKGLEGTELRGLVPIDREVLKEPPKALIKKVESNFDGKVYILVQQGAQNVECRTVPPVEATVHANGHVSVILGPMALINNVGSENHGDNNGSLVNCPITIRIDGNNSRSR